MSAETGRKVEEDAVTGNEALKDVDPELFDLIEQEKGRQWSGLELIASENFTSRAVMECMGSCLTNKYAEGYPGKRYYGGNQIIDKIERLCQSRALTAYRLDASQWGVNVQPYSGSPCNFAVYTALLNPHDRIMGLDLPSGGHLTHGYYTYSKKEGTRKAVSATSIFFESLPYRVSGETGLIDYEALAELAALYKPKMIVCGASAYPRDFDYAKFRQIADANGALLMMDMAHISGLVATQEANDPFEFCDIVTTTTHKSLRGPRAGMIFYRKDERNFERAINNAIFPGLQGGPHEHAIAGIATQLREVATPAFKQYCIAIKANIAAMANALIEMGYKLASDGTDNHLLVWDLRPLGITGSKMEKVCDAIHITLNKNSVHGDRSAVTPGGVRIGSPALTSRGLKEADFIKIAGFLDRAAKIAVRIQQSAGRMLRNFVPALAADEEVAALCGEVQAFARSFPMPGFDVSSMKYGVDYAASGKGNGGKADGNRAPDAPAGDKA